MPPRKDTLKRRLRSSGGKLLRRFGLLPGGMPDGLGDDERLAGTGLEGEVLLFFPDTADSLYQLRGWYGPLRELHQAQGLTIVCMDSRLARLIRAELDVPVLTIAQESTLDELVARSTLKICLYVNYNPLNFLALRLRSVIHVSLLHGDSDKSVSVSNQVKAYDFSFVAGQAGIDRYARYTALFDAAARCIPVGRPSLDTDPVPPVLTRVDGARPVVLYAPTWEGGQASVAYGSLPTHAVALVSSLMDAGARVIYRPHPLTGVRVPSYGEADARLRELLAGADHTVSEGRALMDDFAAADLLICDISAVANDWLVTGKPIVITRPAGDLTREAATRLLEVAPRLSAADAPRAGELAVREITEDPGRDERIALAEYYLGDIRPGASLERFLTACRDLADLRDREWGRIEANEEGS
ncbi:MULTISPECIES: CDP-glycerol glycerophosphotransferase family protein [unclassified Pseudactinotalea]|uniref:CDP-glycerol glycerophosphotransferase family protein n=1 Tax=unclassified Pseudactinotalea TaxID=2649176 RepID=UPI00128B5CFC|nr:MULTISPECIES: CDP-glycerol glycerophosphotransferase family protein [unclassified Pseudactinotalea]MPV50701.1 glycosyl transferase [Pseudactinotalea sp. HY160]QGH70073.1 glycosyl transferase [Pseudactinotalea sp. HY158]